MSDSASPPPSSRSPSDRLSSDEARALWERALEIQLEASRRAEQRALSKGESEEDGPLSSGFTPDEVVAAAREAGISEHHMSEALAEMRATGASGGKTPGRMDRMSNRLLADPKRTIDVSRRIEAPPEQVLDAMRDRLPAHPYFLNLRDIQGRDPLVDGILVFDAPGWNIYSTNQTPFVSGVVQAGLDVLLVTIRAAGGDPGSHEGSTGGSDDEPGPVATEVTIRAPLRKSRRSHGWWILGMGAPLSCAVGGGGVAAGAVLGAALSPVIAVGAAALAGLAGAGITAAGTLWGVRWTFRWATNRAQGVLDDLLRSIDLHARTGGGFLPPEPSPGRPSETGSSDGVFGALGL